MKFVAISIKVVEQKDQKVSIDSVMDVILSECDESTKKSRGFNFNNETSQLEFYVEYEDEVQATEGVKRFEELLSESPVQSPTVTKRETIPTYCLIIFANKK